MAGFKEDVQTCEGCSRIGQRTWAGLLFASATGPGGGIVPDVAANGTGDLRPWHEFAVRISAGYQTPS